MLVKKKPYWFQKEETLPINHPRIQVSPDSSQPGATNQNENENQNENDDSNIGYIAGNQKEGVVVKFKLSAVKNAFL